MRFPLVLLPTLALALLGGCSTEPPDPDPKGEVGLRRRLGIPDEAARVLILSQSSHLDIDWLETHEDYYRSYVEDIFLAAETWLDDEPAAYYSIAEMGFLARHVEEHGDGLRRHVETGRLRIVGGGVTSPDTLLPTDEALVRDYLLGTLFAEEALGVRPRAAWLPDSFGHTPTLPDLLREMGFSSVGFGRADGARGMYEIMFLGLDPIVPGSTAAMLRDLGSADFVWVGPGGAEVLAHYMPVDLYCQGDDIDFEGLILPGQRFGAEMGDDPAFTNGRIAEYIDELTPYARTPYLFVPVGCDFQPPRPLLGEYARRWNRDRYAESGVWIALATFEDYADLVAFHDEELPRMEADINPYWTGFYGSRPDLKRRARLAAESLAALEPFLAFAAGRGLLAGPVVLADAWWIVALANHHDFITGTATDEVVAAEQSPWLDQAIATAEQGWLTVSTALAAEVTTDAAPTGEPVVVFNPGPFDRSEVVEVEVALTGPLVADDGDDLLPAQPVGPGRVAFLAREVPAFGWRVYALRSGSAGGATVVVDDAWATLSTGTLEARLERDVAGSWELVSLVAGGDETLAGNSLQWVRYADDGGLWRIGSEMPGCTFAVEEVLSPRYLELVEAGPARVTLHLLARGVRFEIVAGAGDDRLVLRASGATPTATTTVLRMWPAGADDRLTMGVAAGFADRPLARLYEPTFWPAVTWVASGAAVVHLGASTGVHGTADGALEWMVLRNANSEAPCDLLGATGFDDSEHTLVYALGATGGALDPARETARSMALTRPLVAVAPGRHAGTLPAAARLFSVEGSGVVPTALKPADRGDGIVLHLLRPGREPVDVTIRHGLLWTGTLSRPDLLERDDVPFGTPIEGGVAATLDAPLTALRLRDVK